MEHLKAAKRQADRDGGLYGLDPMSASHPQSALQSHPYLPLVSVGSGRLILTLLAANLAVHGVNLAWEGGHPALYVVAAGLAAASAICGMTSALSLASTSGICAASKRGGYLFALGMLMVVGGTLVNLVLPDRAPPWVAPSLFLMAIVLSTAGILAFPSRELARSEQIATWFDLATILLTGALAFWLFGLDHERIGVIPFWPYKVGVVAFAATSLALAGALLLLLLRHNTAIPHPALVYLAAGTGILIVVEILPWCFALSTGSSPPPPGYLGWTVFSLSVALVGAAIRQSTRDGVDTSARAMAAIPYASTCLIGLLLFTSVFVREAWIQNISILLPTLFIALALVVGRQTFVASDRARMVRELTEARDAAEKANASRLHFLANISHDLRTPLNGILGCAQIMLRDKDVTSKQRELLKTTMSCTEHLQNLINDLLDMSKLESGRLELAPSPFDLRAFLFELTKTFALQAEEKNLHFDIETPDGLPPWITCDRKRLRQILGNLISNAIKFTDRGSVCVHAERAGNHLRFTVSDTGCGILPDRLPDLFTPFQTLDEKSLKLEGTGLGLSISRKLTRKMGGDITVESTLGQGTTFEVTIPLEEADPIRETQRTVVDYKGLRRRILLVDDKASNRVILRSMLEGIEFLVNEAESGEEALKLVEKLKPDVAILDLMMPGMDGFELCRRIQGLNISKPPVCFALSAMAGDYLVEKCRAAGFKELIRKPLALEALLDALRKHADIEWVYGVFRPEPSEPKLALSSRPVETVPSSDQLNALIDMARRGYVRNIETQLNELVAEDSTLKAFAERARGYLTDFKLKELGQWLASLQTHTAVHG